MGELKLGIDKIRAYPSTLSLSFDALCRARGRDPAKTIEHLWVEERSVMPPWEDAVTMAVNAAAALVDDSDREAIELVIVGTETAVDMEKPISSWVHRFLGLKSGCRNFEIKHACYAATAGLQMALAWLASPMGRGKKALVVGTDASLLGLGTPHEYVLGAGAVAAVLSAEPRFLEFDLEGHGVYAAEVSDVIRPTRRIETGSSERSLFAYLEAVHGAYDAFLHHHPNVDFVRDFSGLVYHAPFGGITLRAHQSLLGRRPAATRASIVADFDRRSKPALQHQRRTGGLYGGSTLLSLLGLVDGIPSLIPGDPIGIFSFGSGSCAEFYRGRLGPAAQEIAAQAGVADLLEAREAVDVELYEELERERDASVERSSYEPRLSPLSSHYARCWSGRRRCVLRRINDWERTYEWS